MEKVKTSDLSVQEIKYGLIQMLISLDEYGCEDLKHYDKVVDSACILISQNYLSDK